MDKLNFLCSVNRLFSTAMFRLKIFFILFYCSCRLSLAAASIDSSISIIPRPASLIHLPGIFNLTAQTSLYVHNTEEEKDAQVFNAFLKNEYGISLPVTRTKPAAGKVIELYGRTDYLPNKNEYRIFIDSNHVVMLAKGHGLFYGLISLIQLIHQNRDSSLYIPCVSISDYPRFEWRGMHLDVSRHFFPKEFIIRYIDYLARYKMNTFHWHLTDDQGWRIEIKKYPLLTEVGAWRKGSMIGLYRDQKFDSVRYGGYYTQEDIREVVAYAESRHITIIPEIEMPGHSVAALAAYPQYSCTGDSLEVGPAWGGYDDIFCPKEETFSFLDSILTEVIELFPGKYIHIGGDEVSKKRWKSCSHCKELMVQQGLKNEEELQSYFIRRIDSFLTSKGKQLVGWDEILEGGLSPNAVVMSWRGTEGGIAAAKQNHDVVMSPQKPCYFDHYQSVNEGEPLSIGGYNPIEAVYAYEPVPSELNAEQAKHILGAQANLWTEYISTIPHVEYMIFPRMCALAEAVWTPSDNKSFDDFVRRLPAHFKYFDSQKIHYSKAVFEVTSNQSPAKNHDGIFILLSTAVKNAVIHYSLDSSSVTSSSPVFHDSIHITNSTQLKANTLLNGNVAGKELIVNFQFSKSTGKNITLDPLPSKTYNTGGAFRLVDGQTSALPWRNRDWLGFSGTNMNAVIDLQQKTSFDSITVDVLEDKASRIYFPKSISIYVSNDANNFQLLKKVSTDTISQPQRIITLVVGKTSSRYVKVVAENAGTIPAGFPGAGQAAWLFVDEIMIE